MNVDTKTMNDWWKQNEPAIKKSKMQITEADEELFSFTSKSEKSNESNNEIPYFDYSIWTRHHWGGLVVNIGHLRWGEFQK